MKYITGKTYHKKTVKNVLLDIPKGTEVELIDNLLYLGNEPICYITSGQSHEYFARNDDGNGLERYKLSHQIVDKIIEIVSAYNERYKAIVLSFDENTTDDEKVKAFASLEDTVSEAYKKIKVVLPRGVDNFNNKLTTYFYNAEIEQLEQILRVL